MRTFIRAALVGAAMLVTIPAHAITFAEFSGASPNWFGYNGAATGGSLTGNTKVNFDGSAFGFDEVATNTTFKLTATSSTAPSAWASGMNATQIFQTGSLTFTASNAFAAAHGGLTNLLTVTFTNGALNVTPLGSKNVAFTVTDGEEHPGTSYPNYLDVASRSRTLEAVGAYDGAARRQKSDHRRTL